MKTKIMIFFVFAIMIFPLLIPNVSAESVTEPNYGQDCEVLHIWNYAIDDCDFRINSINFLFSLLFPIGVAIIAIILIVVKYKRKF